MPSRSRKKRIINQSRWAEIREEGLQRMKKYYESNKECILSASHEKYALDPEFHKKKSNLLYADNLQPKKEASKQSKYAENPQPIKEASKVISKRKYNEDPQPKKKASKVISKRKYNEDPQPKKEASKRKSNEDPQPKKTASKRKYDASKRKYDNPQPKKEAAKRNSKLAYSENPIRKKRASQKHYKSNRDVKRKSEKDRHSLAQPKPDLKHKYIDSVQRSLFDDRSTKCALKMPLSNVATRVI